MSSRSLTVCATVAAAVLLMLTDACTHTHSYTLTHLCFLCLGCRYVQQQLSAAAGGELQPSTVAALDFEAQLRTSCCHKARLLHYFPVQQEQQQPAAAAGSAADHADNDWCGWHLDHGALTGAVGPMTACGVWCVVCAYALLCYAPQYRCIYCCYRCCYYHCYCYLHVAAAAAAATALYLS